MQLDIVSRSLTVSAVFHRSVGNTLRIYLDICSSRDYYLFCFRSSLCRIASLGRFFESHVRPAWLDESRIRFAVNRVDARSCTYFGIECLYLTELNGFGAKI